MWPQPRRLDSSPSERGRPVDVHRTRTPAGWNAQRFGDQCGCVLPVGVVSQVCIKHTRGHEFGSAFMAVCWALPSASCDHRLADT